MIVNIVNGYFRLLKFIIVCCLAVMVVLVFGNVVLRYAFNSGITVSEELSRWLFVWLTFLGATVAMKEHTHLGMDSVVSRLPAWGKKACFIVSHLPINQHIVAWHAAAFERLGGESCPQHKTIG